MAGGPLDRMRRRNSFLNYKTGGGKLRMKSLNRATLVGNVGKDPEVKYLPNGTAVAKFSMATSERYKDKAGEWVDRTDWHNIVAWAKLAEIAEKYVKKGNQLFVEGQIQTRSWDDKTSGQKKYMTEINAKDLILLGGKGGPDYGDEGKTENKSEERR